jgi:hypothetical protein
LEGEVISGMRMGVKEQEENENRGEENEISRSIFSKQRIALLNHRKRVQMLLVDLDLMEKWEHSEEKELEEGDLVSFVDEGMERREVQRVLLEVELQVAPLPSRVAKGKLEGQEESAVNTSLVGERHLFNKM